MLVYPLQLDRDGLDDLNVQVNWQRKGGTYWVRYVHVELLGFDTAGKKNMWWRMEILATCFTCMATFKTPI